MKLFHIHDWGKYGEPFGTSLADFTKLQSRYCNSCNKCQVRKVTAPWNIWFTPAAMSHKMEQTK
jgi:hypothetical protein